jgi:hypothetical protein
MLGDIAEGGLVLILVVVVVLLVTLESLVA